MTVRNVAAAVLVGVLLPALVACGGGKSSQTTQTTQSAATMAASPMASTEAQRETAALPSQAIAPVPATLNCGEEKPVWANEHSKAYHFANDPYYGRTKHGEYLCLAQAQAKGYHAAGAMHRGSGKHHHGRAMPTATPEGGN